MLIRQPIRNNRTIGEKKPRVFDALIDTDDGEIYLELKSAKQKGEERMAEYRQKVSERFDRGVENRKKTAMRQKIRKVIRDLDKILNRGDKKRNVKEGILLPPPLRRPVHGESEGS